MPSNPPDPTTAPRSRPGGPDRARRRHRGAPVLLVALLTLTTAVLCVPVAAAQDGGSGGDRVETTTTVGPEVGPTSECSPGHIVRRPDCGVAPQSPTDPGGWLQVSLFYLICVAVLGIVGLVWWRSRVARRKRREAGLDPVTLARASGQGVRRSTRSEPTAETSSKHPEASAGR